MPHIAVKVNMLTDIDVEPVSEYRRAKVILCHVIIIIIFFNELLTKRSSEHIKYKYRIECRIALSGHYSQDKPNTRAAGPPACC